MKIEELITHHTAGRHISDHTFTQLIGFNFNRKSLINKNALTFENCTFKKGFEISNLKNNISLNFINCHFEDGLQRFSDLSLFRLHFEDCSFSNLGIVDSDIITFNVRNCSSNVHYIQFRSITSARLVIDWKDESKQASFGIWSTEIERIDIKSQNNVKDLIIFDTKDLVFEGSLLGELSIPAKKFNTIKIEPFYINDSSGSKVEYKKIESLSLVNNSFSGTLKIRNVDIESLSISNIECYDGMISLIDLEIEKAQFLDVNIKSFYWSQLNFRKILKIERGDLSNLKFANINWLKGRKVSDSEIGKTKEQIIKKGHLKKLQDERETYRQLKAASSSSHNHIEALSFYKNEMRLYWQGIRINGGVSIWDRILVFLNRWVSDFGQSWALPLLWLFVFHTLIYFCIIGFNFTKDYEAFRVGAGQYFELLNPVHKTPDYIKGFNIGLELLLRVLDGFFIYHFVRATRKFGKV